ncbi:MAG TPA: ATP-binding protein [Kofleriaceae bacterium]
MSVCSPDEARRITITGALARAGLELTDSVADLSTIHITDDDKGISIWNDDELLIQMSIFVTPDDLAGIVRLAVEAVTLAATVRSFEETEPAGIIAASIAHDARNALVPVMFAADALAHRYPEALDLTRLLVEGCDRAAKILKPILPAQCSSGSLRTCANTVISELTETMRAIAHHAKVATRLEEPLAAVRVERSELERMLLALIADAAEPRRKTDRIIVTTSSHLVDGVEPDDAPEGDWIQIAVDHDGDNTNDSIHNANRTTASTGLGLSSITRLMRSAGGHVSIDNRRRGSTFRIWLPRAD